jgi:hypothetical protein
MDRWVIIEETKTTPFYDKEYNFCYLIFISKFNSVWTFILGFKLDSPKLVGTKYIKNIINNFDKYLTNLIKGLDGFDRILDKLNNDPDFFMEEYTFFHKSRFICRLSIPEELCDAVDRKLQQYLSNY